MTTWNNQNPNTTNWSDATTTSQPIDLVVGTPMGLLLCLTYAESQTVYSTIWEKHNSDSAAWEKHSNSSGGWSKVISNPASWSKVNPN